ncbi:hypothetical protein IE4872_PD01829 (plasmid) [Rhizobium gallicum]|uniref:Uncharacterized protein n=1 Tax=Rhizobium gallicum TaxID=56730 RepID=A0A1L5NWV0_9HYPH|nr:hypothetical protein IE4872_PD01829 [Rhizobium gallicum]
MSRPKLSLSIMWSLRNKRLSRSDADAPRSKFGSKRGGVARLCEPAYGVGIEQEFSKYLIEIQNRLKKAPQPLVRTRLLTN